MGHLCCGKVQPLYMGKICGGRGGCGVTPEGRYCCQSLPCSSCAAPPSARQRQGPFEILLTRCPARPCGMVALYCASYYYIPPLT